MNAYATSATATPAQIARFWSYVDSTDPDGCWLWLRCVAVDGYGRTYLTGRQYMAHRLAYIFSRGPVPAGLELDHRCRNKACVNPDHLEPVTHAENVRRGAAPDATRARHAAMTHCRRGHAFDGVNSYLYNGIRICRECKRVTKAERRRREQT